MLVGPLWGLRGLEGWIPPGKGRFEEVGVRLLEWAKALAAWEYHFARIPQLCFPLEPGTVFVESLE